MSLSADVRHAFQALAVLASRLGEDHQAERLARRLGLPPGALGKSFQRLVRRGLLESRRGPGGGYRLARDPRRISLAAVAAALDLQDPRRGVCLLEERPCGGRVPPCLLHDAALEADEHMRGALGRLTLADLASDPRPGRGGP